MDDRGDSREREPLFGMRLSDFDAGECAAWLLTDRRTKEQGVGLFVTPNIQHISDMRTDPEFAAAMRGADLIVCDGFPVYRYAQTQGQALPGRVTGREVVDLMMAEPKALAAHRAVFVVDSDVTAAAIGTWLTETSPTTAFVTIVPPFGFDRDPAYALQMADRIAAFGATLVFLCIGAPRSEIFVHRHRASLPPCWALCVGQSFKISLGLTPLPPPVMVTLNLEWLWRIVLEPRRMLRRYGPSSIGFARSVFADLRQKRAEGRR